MMPKLRIYLAGPMRGIEDNNGPAFVEAAAALRAQGHEVWSPYEHDEKLLVDDFSSVKRQVFTRDLVALLEQDAIVLLDGWNRSHGACLECHTADVVSMPIFLFDVRVPGLLVPKSTHDWRWRSGS